MSMDEQAIIARIQALFPVAAVDISGADCSFEVYVVSDSLRGKSTLQRQRSILDLFKDELKSGRLHALSIKARTKDEMAAGSGLIQIQ